MNVTACCALALYRRGKPSDLEEALSVLTRRPGTYDTYNDRLLPFVLAERDYGKRGDWQARALKAYEHFTGTAQDLASVMDTQSVLYLLGSKKEAIKVSKALLPILDSFERALQIGAAEKSEFRGGIELIYRQLQDALQKLGLRPIPAQGEPFDKLV